MLLWILLIVIAIVLLAGLGGGRFYRRRYIGPPMAGPGAQPGTPVVHNTIVTPGGTTTGPGTTVVEE